MLNPEELRFVIKEMFSFDISSQIYSGFKLSLITKITVTIPDELITITFTKERI
jgi:hypothetical protein